MKLRIFIFSILAAFTFSLPAENFRTEVGQFNRLVVADDIDVIYRCVPDSTGMAFFSGEESIKDIFVFSVRKNTLTLQLAKDREKPGNLPAIRLYSDFLTYVENGSDGSVTVEEPAPCAEFKAVQVGNGDVTVTGLRATEVKGELNTGNGTVRLSGRCTKASFRMVGTGMIQADELKCGSASATILGSGTIGCDPGESLMVKGIGTTKIYYKGDPKIKKTGGGNLIHIP